MKNVVASSGTALTEEQIKLLQRYSKNINMALMLMTLVKMQLRRN